MTMSTYIIFTRSVSLRASNHINVDSSDIRSSQQQDIRNRRHKAEWISIVIIENIINKNMANRNTKRTTETDKHQSFIFLVTRSMDPFENAHNKAKGGY